MNIEEKIFKRTNINIKKLKNYGFKKYNDNFLYSKNILQDKFRVDIEINKDGKVIGTVIDIEFNEEYNNFRIKTIDGEFVNSVRKEIENLLIDIRNNCFDKKYFIYNQTNRITNLIIKKYNDYPEFPWEKSPGCGVFRNTNNKKWYGLIMDINKNKLDNENKEIEIINLKIDKHKIPELILKSGIYKAYHMNKEHWVSIILDDTLTDKEIMNYIEESHEFTEK